MKKRLLIAAAAVSMLLSFGACSSVPAAKQVESVETENITVESETQTETETEVSEDVPEGMMRSYLTGELIPVEEGQKRPFAIMINNIQDSLPQSGIKYADMVYEAQVEGGITRLMAVYGDPTGVEKIGSIRSARHYYIDFARDNDAIYVHFGQSKYAEARIATESIKTISGLSAYGTQVFYRSTDRNAPHNVYTTDEMLEKGVELTDNERNHPDTYKGHLKFSSMDYAPDGGVDADKVSIPFDSKPYFEYNTTDGLYYRYQYGEKHIDRETDEQLAFKNIIIQYVAEKSISKEDHQDLTLTGKGNGYFITHGKAVEITWKRDSDKDVTRYYDKDGNEIELNIGKTFFEYVSNDKKVTIE